MALTDLAKQLLKKNDTSYVESDNIAQVINDLDTMFLSQRRNFERSWYDNNFFDDGKHYRFLSRTTGRIIDLETNNQNGIPKRSIPKASRQIRGMANVILSLDPVPIIYPEKVTRVNYPNPQDYEIAWQESKITAQKIGHWIEEEWKNQELETKLALMAILTMKHSVSFCQVWADPEDEKINTQIYDAFDIRLNGFLNDIQDSNAIIKAIPMTLREIKANPIFDPDKVALIKADNKLASTQMKESYLMTTQGGKFHTDHSSTAVVYEAYLKEFLNEDNWTTAIKDLQDSSEFLDGKSKGDQIIRQSFSVADQGIKDKYVDIDQYPFSDFRMEPGPIYQVPTIERFKAQNKSLDGVVSRIEAFVNTMTVGVYQKRKGENFRINNQGSAQVIEYENQPLTQMNMTTMPGQVFALVQLLTSFIEEQGVTVTSTGKIPTGVKAHAAIESLKSSELSNMGINIKMLRKTVKNITEKFLDIADQYFISPQTVERLEKGEPDYFDVIGNRGVELRKKLKQEQAVEGVVPIKRGYKVDIQIESGMAHTEMGRKETMIELANWLKELAQEGWLPAEAVQEVLRQVLETFKFGGTSDIMEAVDKFGMGKGKMTDEQKEEMKIAFLEVIRDLSQGEQGGQQLSQPVQQPGQVLQ